jgi:hypothetical protein
MTDENPIPTLAVDVPFLITASELRARKNKKRRMQVDLPCRSGAFLQLVDPGLKAKNK